MLKIANESIYNHDLEKNHRFPMIKYKLLPEILINEGTCNLENFFIPDIIDEKYILLTHDYNYYRRLINFELDRKEH